MKSGRPCFQTKKVKGVTASCSFFLQWASGHWDNRNNKNKHNGRQHCVLGTVLSVSVISPFISTTAQGTVILAYVLCKKKRGKHTEDYTEACLTAQPWVLTVIVALNKT